VRASALGRKRSETPGGGYPRRESPSIGRREVMSERLDPERDEKRLDELGDEIEEARRSLDDRLTDDQGPDFIDRGTVETDKVDNAIAPPG
jgi:hypothetical protein